MKFLNSTSIPVSGIANNILPFYWMTPGQVSGTTAGSPDITQRFLASLIGVAYRIQFLCRVPGKGLTLNNAAHVLSSAELGASSG